MRQQGFRVGLVLAAGGLMATVSLGLVAPLVHAEQATQTTQKTDVKKEAKQDVKTSMKKDVKKDLKVVGNSETKKYHKSSCPWVKKMNKDNRVEFASAAEAKKAGYEPCKVCLGSPSHTKHTKPSAASGAPPKSETKKKDATAGQ